MLHVEENMLLPTGHISHFNPGQERSRILQPSRKPPEAEQKTIDKTGKKTKYRSASQIHRLTSPDSNLCSKPVTDFHCFLVPLFWFTGFSLTREGKSQFVQNKSRQGPAAVHRPRAREVCCVSICCLKVTQLSSVTKLTNKTHINHKLTQTVEQCRKVAAKPPRDTKPPQY